jgi:hypothetical protein
VNRVLRLKIALPVVMALAAVMLGIVAARLAVKPNSEGANQLGHSVGINIDPGPDSILNLVNRADAIVVGTVGTAAQVVEIEAHKRGSPSDPPPPRFILTAYPIVIEEVLLDDGTVQSESPPVIMIKGMPDQEFEFGQYRRMLVPGHRYLLVLDRRPDKSYSVYRAGGLYSIAGPVVTRWDKDMSSVTFTDKVATADFIQAVKNAIPFKQPFSPLRDIHQMVVDTSIPQPVPPEP